MMTQCSLLGELSIKTLHSVTFCPAGQYDRGLETMINVDAGSCKSKAFSKNTLSAVIHDSFLLQMKVFCIMGVTKI